MSRVSSIVLSPANPLLTPLSLAVNLVTSMAEQGKSKVRDPTFVQGDPPCHICDAVSSSLPNRPYLVCNTPSPSRAICTMRHAL